MSRVPGSMAPREDGGRLYAGVQAAGRVMLSGGVSGVAARVCTHPFDTIKSRQQVAGSLDGGARRLARASMPTALLSVLRDEGVAGLYRGFGAVAFGVPFASAFYFGGYEWSKALLGEGTAAYICAGLLGQSAAGLVYTPVDVIKERLQVQSLVGRQGYRYASALDGLRSVVRAEGAAGLMRGYWANNATWWPWNVAYFLAYECGRGGGRGCARTRVLGPSALFLRIGTGATSWRVTRASPTRRSFRPRPRPRAPAPPPLRRRCSPRPRTSSRRGCRRRSERGAVRRRSRRTCTAPKVREHSSRGRRLACSPSRPGVPSPSSSTRSPSGSRPPLALASSRSWRG